MTKHPLDDEDITVVVTLHHRTTDTFELVLERSREGDKGVTVAGILALNRAMDQMLAKIEIQGGG